MIDVQSLTPAERLLWNYGFRKPEHIDLEGIALARGASVIYRSLDGCAARLLTDGEKAVISIEKSDNRGRQRFSLGHELAHWINDAKRSSFKCSSESIGPQNSEAASVEADANVYASQLILPDYMVAPWSQGRLMTLNVAVELAEAFKASVTASAIKLVKRSSGPACVVCHSQRGRRWFVRSRAWPLDLYLRSELHQDTAAFEIAFKATNRMSTPHKEEAKWWMSGRDVFRMMVQSQSMKLADETVLTMLAMAPAH
ncbi:ImmA/IrrE family metallo-endopeptidase [Variovorax sp. J22P240]|uniref:ImmA/IrrE family metallo-endopeptidase n=1 Tax=Variovorax sp. J22P240 TaxID=3053514 RepID=UPI002575CFD4|nr:ImmA/IrrE family metallo-endopeptidase [Variovorax sp. J22P240]MDM0001200.1 ImmA/IrrE family metallo-endopeptidase [Variovorax sp. J22P240]